ncbi:MAG: DUF6090 family protein [Saprospiraceae bacterium]
MKNTFRKLRQNFLNKWEISKYLRYAIGEIVLVVIGILIALSINNWNVNNNEKDNRKIYLQELNTEINSNLGLFKFVFEKAKKNNKLTNYYLETLNNENSSAVPDSIITSMVYNFEHSLVYDPTESAIDDFINSGVLKSLEDEDLKRRIFQIKFVYKSFAQLNEDYRKVKDKYLIPYFIKNGNMIERNNPIFKAQSSKLNFSPNRQAFLNNKEFSNILFTIEIINSRNEDQFSSWVPFLETLSEDIEKYLAE